MNLDQRIRMMMGDLVVNNMAAKLDLEEMQKLIAAKDQEIAELKAKLPPEQPKE
jgi:hypothetical protein